MHEIDEHITLRRMGFEYNNGAFQRVWPVPHDPDVVHIITITKLDNVWSLVWQRDISFTIAERRDLTFSGIVDAFWDEVFSTAERKFKLLQEEAKRIAGGAG